jgi:hypothetical protein
LISLATALLTAALSPLIYLSVASALSTDSSQAYWWHMVVIPGISLSLTAALGLAGLGGMLIIEWNRGRVIGQTGRTWDRIRIAFLVSALSGALSLLSGIVLGFIYVAAYRTVFAIEVAVQMSLAVSVGLFLFWTAERIDPPARRLRQVALLLGGVAAGTFTATSAASLLGGMYVDPVLGGTIGLFGTATGTLSVVVWMIVYGAILGGSRTTEQSLRSLRLGLKT